MTGQGRARGAPGEPGLVFTGSRSVAVVTWAAAGLLVQADQGGRTGGLAGTT